MKKYNKPQMQIVALQSQTMNCQIVSYNFNIGEGDSCVNQN